MEDRQFKRASVGSVYEKRLKSEHGQVIKRKRLEEPSPKYIEESPEELIAEAPPKYERKFTQEIPHRHRGFGDQLEVIYKESVNLKNTVSSQDDQLFEKWQSLISKKEILSKKLEDISREEKSLRQKESDLRVKFERERKVYEYQKKNILEDRHKRIQKVRESNKLLKEHLNMLSDLTNVEISGRNQVYELAVSYQDRMVRFRLDFSSEQDTVGYEPIDVSAVESTLMADSCWIARSDIPLLFQKIVTKLEKLKHKIL